MSLLTYGIRPTYDVGLQKQPLNFVPVINDSESLDTVFEQFAKKKKQISARRGERGGS